MKVGSDEGHHVMKTKRCASHCPKRSTIDANMTMIEKLHFPPDELTKSKVNCGIAKKNRAITAATGIFGSTLKIPTQQIVHSFKAPISKSIMQLGTI